MVGVERELATCAPSGDPWPTKAKPSACPAGRFSPPTFATADDRSTAQNRLAGRPAKRRGSDAGGSSHRTRTTFAGRCTWNGCGCGVRPHPAYWRSHLRRKLSTLQDALVPQVIEEPWDCAGFALLDALGLQDPVLIGLIAQLTDSTLQDSFAVTVRRLLQLGQDILSGGTHDARQTGSAP